MEILQGILHFMLYSLKLALAVLFSCLATALILTCQGMGKLIHIIKDRAGKRTDPA